MNGINRVVLMGKLGATPKKEVTPSGKTVATFEISTEEFTKLDDGEKIKRTDWHKIITWGKVAEACVKMLDKGSFVLVEGKIRNVNVEKNTYEIFATDVSFIANYGNGGKDK
jgi:single-strand DNA-binding protein